jgi:hypothetical protein
MTYTDRVLLRASQARGRGLKPSLWDTFYLMAYWLVTDPVGTVGDWILARKLAKLERKIFGPIPRSLPEEKSEEKSA